MGLKAPLLFADDTKLAGEMDIRRADRPGQAGRAGWQELYEV